ncbi:MAG TPA: hypothetical protein VGK59_14475 [Ohtaekwangia sp.]
MKLTWKITLLIITLFAAGCDCEENEPCGDTEIISITSVILYGMSPSKDSLTIIPGSVHFNHSCSGKNPLRQKSTCTEWEQLTSSFDLTEFQALNLNSCARCYDGADISISVKTASSYHRIVIPYYLTNEGQIPDEIQSLYEKIAGIRSEVQSLACEE